MIMSNAPVKFAALGLAILLIPGILLAQSSEENEADAISGPRSSSSGNGPDLKQAAQSIVKKTNAFRREHGHSPVTVNSDLTDAAQYFADFMARTDKYGHRADGKRPADRAENHGYDYCIVLENIAYQYSSRGFRTKALARKFERGWEQSPGHRKNMLDPDVTETGVAISQSEETGHYYAVQMFGRPKSKQIEFQIENKSGEEVTYRIKDRKFTLPPRYTRTHSRCRPTELVFDLGSDKSKSVSPPNGAHLTIQNGQDGQLTVLEAMNGG